MIYEPVLYPDKEQRLAVDVPPEKPQALSIRYSYPPVLGVGISRNRCIKVCLHETTTSSPRVLKRRNGFA
ncbi:hypothetical protein M514_18423 [Trichuris suis]|uniref:Uncharacterized protein n=1 Tax=Trichuris suis TaxID=68888 RepID=A0A085NIH8_9BILA|nr:hypothetical protein M514_18423 [Trichuris suis]